MMPSERSQKTESEPRATSDIWTGRTPNIAFRVLIAFNSACSQNRKFSEVENRHGCTALYSVVGTALACLKAILTSPNAAADPMPLQKTVTSLAESTSTKEEEASSKMTNIFLSTLLLLQYRRTTE